jgi:hypothetical protein
MPLEPPSHQFSDRTLIIPSEWAKDGAFTMFCKVFSDYLYVEIIDRNSMMRWQAALTKRECEKVVHGIPNIGMIELYEIIKLAVTNTKRSMLTSEAYPFFVRRGDDIDFEIAFTPGSILRVQFTISLSASKECHERFVERWRGILSAPLDTYPNSSVLRWNNKAFSRGSALGPLDFTIPRTDLYRFTGRIFVSIPGDNPGASRIEFKCGNFFMHVPVQPTTVKDQYLADIDMILDATKGSEPIVYLHNCALLEKIPGLVSSITIIKV